MNEPLDKDEQLVGKEYAIDGVLFDQDLDEKVREALLHSPDVDHANVQVSVKEGIVTLTGFVVDKSSKREAGRCVRRVKGVKDVINQLTIKSYA